MFICFVQIQDQMWSSSHQLKSITTVGPHMLAARKSIHNSSSTKLIQFMLAWLMQVMTCAYAGCEMSNDIYINSKYPR